MSSPLPHQTNLCSVKRGLGNLCLLNETAGLLLCTMAENTLSSRIYSCINAGQHQNQRIPFSQDSPISLMDIAEETRPNSQTRSACTKPWPCPGGKSCCEKPFSSFLDSAITAWTRSIWLFFCDSSSPSFWRRTAGIKVSPKEKARFQKLKEVKNIGLGGNGRFPQPAPAACQPPKLRQSAFTHLLLMEV